MALPAFVGRNGQLASSALAVARGTETGLSEERGASSAGRFGADLFGGASIVETFGLSHAAGGSRDRYERQDLWDLPRRVGTRRRLSTSPVVETRQARRAAHPRYPRGWITNLRSPANAGDHPNRARGAAEAGECLQSRERQSEVQVGPGEAVAAPG